jgi:hypothetical protein
MKVVIGDHFSSTEDEVMKAMNRIARKVMK